MNLNRLLNITLISIIIIVFVAYLKVCNDRNNLKETNKKLIDKDTSLCQHMLKTYPQSETVKVKCEV